VLSGKTEAATHSAKERIFSRHTVPVYSKIQQNGLQISFS